MRHAPHTTRHMRDNPALSADFSLVLGGPLYQLLRRSRISDDVLGHLWRRIVLIALMAWLPLLLISLFSGHALSGEVAVPFIKDVEVHTRFLLVLPLMVAAELLVHVRLRGVVQQFTARELFATEDLPRFRAAVERAMKLRNSVPAEILMVIAVYTLGTFIWRQVDFIHSHTWYATPGANGPQLSAAGFWYAYVSLPMFQLLVLRWYFRIFIWARFLWQVSRIPLRLLPTHADRLGGLSFVAGSFYAFGPLAAAHGAWLASVLANRIFHEGAQLIAFKLEIGLLVLFLQVLMLGPLLVFAPQLAQAKRDGKREYGILVMRHNREFEEKWLRNPHSPNKELLGASEMSSLIDLGDSFSVIQEMRSVPVTRDAMVFLAVVTVAPLLPLLLTMMSVEELLRKLIGVLF